MIKFLDFDLIWFVSLFNSTQDSANSVRQTEKAAAGEAGVCSGSGQDQKGSV